jgi:uncharacterized integral membrane protein (TIGR00698 family)
VTSATATTTLDEPAPAVDFSWPWRIASIALVLALSWLVRLLERGLPPALPNLTWLKSVEFPVYAILIGLAVGALLGALGLRERLRWAFRTELFIKTGLVLLGASIDLAAIARAAVPSIVQSLLLISSVFLATWWLAGKLGLDDRLRALLAAALSICGVSAAIAAAGAVHAKKEQLAYVASLVIVFAIPMIFIQPWIATQLNLSQVVAGAWIGGNIDTTAAVTAAGSIVGDDALKMAAIVKSTQNAMMGFVAVLLTFWFVTRVERLPGVSISWRTIWTRFPKFILGFIAASALATWYINTAADPKAAADIVKVAGTDMRVWFFTLAFVCIGLELRVTSLREAGVRPVIVFAAASVLNLVLALVLASVIFSGFTL